MLRPALRHMIELTLVILLAITALFGAAAWRLSHGEISADFLRAPLVRGLENQVEGGHGGVNHIGIVWYDQAKSLGLQLDGVWLRDSQGRLVLRAAKVQAAVALDSLLLFAPAPGRIAAEDFFVAVSVSPQGRYELGYAAKGKPEVYTGLGKLFAEITQSARRNRPASFLRDLDLQRGQLSLRQMDGTVSWTGDVRSLVFKKAAGLIVADCDLAIGTGPGRADMKAKARAAVGLKDATVEAEVHNLNPALVFPSVGLTRGVSALDAAIEGRGSFAYGQSTGVQSADVAFSAGKGRIRFGKTFQPFDRALVQASYDPQSGDVELGQIRLATASLGVDLKGRLRLIPQGRNAQPARLDFEVSGPRATMIFVEGAQLQTLSNITLKGRFTPEAGRLDVTQGRATLAGKTVESHGELMQALDRDGRPQGRWGARLEARMLGAATVEQAYPFWPESVGASARKWVRGALKKGNLYNVTLKLNVPAGMSEGHITNDMLKVGFDFDNVSIGIVSGLPQIEDGRGRALVQGQRFDLFLTSGRMQKVRLSDGLVSFPEFGEKVSGIFQARARGDLGEVLDILNQKPLFALAESGFEPQDFEGDADVSFKIVRPMRGEVSRGQNVFSFDGRVAKAKIHQVALGLDASDGQLIVTGDNRGLQVNGTAKAGAYRGRVDYRAQFSAVASNAQRLMLDGRVDTGLHGSVPLSAQLSFGRLGGSGDYTSTAAKGDVRWTSGPNAQIKVLAAVAPGGLQQLGLPVSGKTDAFNASLVLDHQGKLWRGPLRVGDLKANVAFTPEEGDRVSLDGQITPADAAMLGLPKIPLFARTQPFRVEVTRSELTQVANFGIGGVVGHADWTSQPNGAVAIGIHSDLSAADLTALGAPRFVRPPKPVALAVDILSAPDGLNANGTFAGIAIKVDMIRAQSALGQTALTAQANLTEDGATNLGLFKTGEFGGQINMTARFAIVDKGLSSGRVDLNLTEAQLAPAQTGWAKPLGAPASVSADLTISQDGALNLTNVVGSGPGLDVAANARFQSGRWVSAHTQRAKIDGLFQGQFDLDRTATSQTITVNGPYLDVRRLISGTEIGRPDKPSEPKGPKRLILDLAIDQMRVSESGYLKDLSVKGDFTGNSSRILSASVNTQVGAPIRVTVGPKDVGSLLEATIADLGSLTSALFQTESLRNGNVVITGPVTDEGFDLVVTVGKVRVKKVPILAQILTLGSLRGFADTLNGSGIEFTDVVIPVRVRGSVLWIDDARATGDAIGLTARGKIDIGNKTMDMTGAVAPAYALNSAIGHIPILGALMISRQGEGVFGLTYSARGPLTAPRVWVNPLSLATPGMFRRIFDGVPIGKAVLKAPPPKIESETVAP